MTPRQAHVRFLGARNRVGQRQPTKQPPLHHGQGRRSKSVSPWTRRPCAARCQNTKEVGSDQLSCPVDKCDDGMTDILGGVVRGRSDDTQIPRINHTEWFWRCSNVAPEVDIFLHSEVLRHIYISCSRRSETCKSSSSLLTHAASYQ